MQIRTLCPATQEKILLEVREIDFWAFSFPNEIGEEERHAWMSYRCPLCKVVEVGYELLPYEDTAVSCSIPADQKEVFEFPALNK